MLKELKSKTLQIQYFLAMDKKLVANVMAMFIASWASF